MSDTVVEVIDLIKKFEDISVLQNISLNIKRGEIFSLVGPDGAGKSTFIKICCGIIPQSSGEIKILDLTWDKNRSEIKKQIGYLSQRFTLYSDLTVDENIDFFAEIHNQKNYLQRKNELLDFTRLKAFRHTLAEYLSGGMKQKLALACSLIHNPQILFLDEPTVGVDPVSRREFWKILSELIKNGMTILMATPYLDEAERCNRVALIDKGKILSCGSPQKIKETIKDKIFEIVCPETRTAHYLLIEEKIFLDVHMFGDKIHITTKRELQHKDIENILIKKNIIVLSIREIIPSIEDVFIAITKTN